MAENFPTKHPVNPFDEKEAPGVTGTKFLYRTSVGNLVVAWKPDDGVKGDYRYFCHGVGLGTYNIQTQQGFTVYSDDVMTVLQDEFEHVPTADMKDDIYKPSLSQIQDGDTIALLYQKKLGPSAWESELSKYQLENSPHLAGVKPTGLVWICSHTMIIKKKKETDGSIFDWWTPKLSGETLVIHKHGCGELYGYDNRNACENFKLDWVKQVYKDPGSDYMKKGNPAYTEMRIYRRKKAT